MFCRERSNPSPKWALPEINRQNYWADLIDRIIMLVIDCKAGDHNRRYLHAVDDAWDLVCDRFGNRRRNPISYHGNNRRAFTSATASGRY